MKNRTFLYSSLLLLALSNPLLSMKSPEETNTPLSKKQTFAEKYLPTALTTLWAESVSLETACYFLPNLRQRIYSYHQCHRYGSNGGSRSHHYTVELMLDSFKDLDSSKVGEIVLASPSWLTIAGDAFSNYDMLFINDKKIFTNIAYVQRDGLLTYNRPEDIITMTKEIKSWDKNTQKQLISALIMIDKNYDAKLLALTIITPPLVWALTHGINHLMQKLDPKKHNEWVNKFADLTKQCKESFIAKAALSASILATYILYQRHSISAQAISIMNNL